jgi:hypothetical protein
MTALGVEPEYEDNLVRLLHLCLLLDPGKLTTIAASGF